MAARHSAALVALALAAAAAAADDEDAPIITALAPYAVLTSFLYEGDFSEPENVHCDPRTGEVYVADPDADAIGVFDVDGVPLFAFGRGGHLNAPRKLATDLEGRILVIDHDADRVKVFNRRGEYLGPLPLPAGVGTHFRAISSDQYGTLALATETEVFVLGPDLKLACRFGRPGKRDGEFRRIVDVATDAAHVYVADAEGRAIQMFDRRCRFVRGWAENAAGRENVSLPSAIAVHPGGFVLLVDTLRQEIKVFRKDGTFIERFGGLGRQPGAVRFPTGLSVGARGRVCVADRGNRRVQLLEAAVSGEISSEEFSPGIAFPWVPVEEIPGSAPLGAVPGSKPLGAVALPSR